MMLVIMKLYNTCVPAPPTCPTWRTNGHVFVFVFVFVFAYVFVFVFVFVFVMLMVRVRIIY